MAHISAPMYWRTIPQRYRLIGRRCTACGAVSFPPKGICPSCLRSSDFQEVPLSGRGRVHTHATVGAGGAPPEFTDQERASGSYPIVIVELEEGPKVIGQLSDIDPNQVRIGMPVTAEVRRIYTDEGVVRYGFKFVPVGGAP